MISVGDVVVFKEILTPDGFLYPASVLKVVSAADGRKDVFDLVALAKDGNESVEALRYSAATSEIRCADANEKIAGVRLPKLFVGGDQVIVGDMGNQILYFVKYMSNQMVLIKNEQGEILEKNMDSVRAA